MKMKLKINIKKGSKGNILRAFFKNKILIIAKKTFKDIHSLKKFIAAEFFLILIPMIMIIISAGIDFGVASPLIAATNLAISIIFILFFLTFGIIYTLIMGTSGASLISEEVNSGTLLILVSKPVSRVNIFLGKYLGLVLYGALISFTTLFSIGWIGTLIKSGNLNHFIALIPFLLSMFIYSIFILCLFGGISMALSSIFKKPRTVSIIIVLLIIISYAIFTFLKVFPGMSSIYSAYQLYHIDLGYHLGNIFVLFVEVLSAVPPSTAWQTFFQMTVGVYSNDALTDPDQGISLGGLAKTNYYPPILSLLLWLGVTILLVIFGLIKLKKREVSN
ncbi:MAG: ABC transporter permease subunit [Candidatus Lokiarchaeota archaeon]|nr:ABC transporter permease subunit [Candidatus Lokiarchaeota archaeon]